MEQDMNFIKERYELCVERIKEIVAQQEVPEKYREYFKSEAEFIISTAEMAAMVAAGTDAEIRMGSISSEVERKAAMSVPTVMTRPA